MLEESKVAVHEADAVRLSAGCVYPEPREHSPVPAIWRWVVRLSLPVLMGISVKALQWLWIDNLHSIRWLDIVGGMALALGLASIALWCVCEWLSDDERRS